MHLRTIARQQRHSGAAVHKVRSAHALACAIALAAATLTSSMAKPVHAASDSRPYDTSLMRLAEILGSIHYLGSLCRKGSEQSWREQMNALLEAEGTTPLRRATLTWRFNKGFRNYSRSYRECTPNAEATVNTFFKEAREITETLLKTK